MTSEDFRDALQDRGLSHDEQERLVHEFSSEEIEKQLGATGVQATLEAAEEHAQWLRGQFLKYLK